MSTRPYRSAKRQEQAAQTREKLIEAARAFLEEHDPALLSLPKIAKAAGVAAGTIYAHFPTEEALIVAAIERHRELTHMVLIDGDLPAERIHEVPLSTYPAYDRYRRWTTLTAHSLGLSRTFKPRRKAVVERWRERLRAVAPTLTDEELAMVGGAVHLFAVSRAWYWLEEHADLTGEQAARAASWAMQTLVEALKADPEAIRRVPPPDPA